MEIFTRRNFVKQAGAGAAAAAFATYLMNRREARGDDDVTPRDDVETGLASEMEDFMASEKKKWDALNAHMVPQFEGQKAYVEHGFARYRCAFVGDPRAVFVPDPDVGEMHAMTGDSMAPEERAWWRKFKNKSLKDAAPKIWEEMAKCSQNLADALRKCGVKVIRNEKCEYPEGIINANAAYKGPKFCSIYGGPPYGRIWDKYFMQIWECGPVRQWEFALRQGTMELFKANPDMIYRSMPYPEPDVNLRGPGTPSFDNAAPKLLPGKQLLFGWGVPDAKHIPSTYDPKTCNDYTSAGNPLGGKFMMEHILRDAGFQWEECFFDSKLTYHFDCFVVMFKEGIIGLPDAPNFGLMSEGLPKCLKDYKIIRIPLEDIARGAANSPCIGDGRIIMDSRCTKTFDLMEKHGLEPVPVDYTACWDAFNSGMDCSDSEIWREND